MQLNEILEESDISQISQKTNISKQNIQVLMDENFAGMIKAKALGFISILERDYQVDLGVLREKALAYYEKHGSEEERMNLSVPMSKGDRDDSRGNSSWIWLIVIGLGVYLAWYFLSQYDLETLRSLLPFMQE